MKQISSKTKFLLISMAIQAVFAIAFMCHRNPDVHWCAIAPIFACSGFVILYDNDDED